MSKQCSVSWCERRVKARGRCRPHDRQIQLGQPIGQITTDPIVLRLPWLRRVEKSGCWLWLGVIRKDRYGKVVVSGRQCLAHRAVYQALVGPIPDGLTLDHLCRVRSCVNPAHLEPVTNRVNILRGESPAAKNARKTHCLRGHALSGDNLIRTSRGGRSCRMCMNAHQRRYYAQRMQA